MSETSLWNRMRPVLQGLGLDPMRVENALGNGCPDANYSHGWIELKQVARWPRNPDGPVTIEFRKGQVPWLTRRWRAGGLCWMLVRVAGEMLLYRGCDAALLRTGLTRTELEQQACWHVRNRLTDSLCRDLQVILTGGDE